MSEDIGENRDIIVQNQTILSYLVDYRISSKGDGTPLGDRDARYATLVKAIEPMAGTVYSNFVDLGHASTSSWIVRTNKPAKQIYRELIVFLNPEHDVLAVFEVDLDKSWSTKDETGDRVQP